MRLMPLQGQGVRDKYKKYLKTYFLLSDSEMHEASRRILSTLLRKIDSFESSSDVLLICATNRK